MALSRKVRPIGRLALLALLAPLAHSLQPSIQPRAAPRHGSRRVGRAASSCSSGRRRPSSFTARHCKAKASGGLGCGCRVGATTPGRTAKREASPEAGCRRYISLAALLIDTRLLPGLLPSTSPSGLVALAVVAQWPHWGGSENWPGARLLAAAVSSRRHKSGCPVCFPTFERERSGF